MKLDGGSVIHNSIIWDNHNLYRTVDFDGNVDVSYTLVQGSQSNFVDRNGYDLSVRLQWGNGNLDQDPLLDGAFIPQSGSPIINMGDPNLFLVIQMGPEMILVIVVVMESMFPQPALTLEMFPQTERAAKIYSFTI